MNELAKAGQKPSETASHPPASKPVSLAPLKFEEAMTALSRVVPQRPGNEVKEHPPSKKHVRAQSTRMTRLDRLFGWRGYD
jgi:hypothetical protein